MTKMRAKSYTVTVMQPLHVDDDEVAAYIEEAVGTWGGSFRPPGSYGDDDMGHPLFGGLTCTAKRKTNGEKS